MINQKLLNHIKQQSQQGINKKNIKQSLIANGWQDFDIEEAFSAIMQEKNQSKKQYWKKVFLIIAGFVVISIIAIFILSKFFNLSARDIAPIDDSDLQLQKRSVIARNNAYFDLIKLEGKIYEPNKFPDKIWNNELAKEIISRNTQSFNYFTEAANKPKFQNPATADPTNITPDSLIPSMGVWGTMAEISSIKAVYLAKQNRDKEAMDEAFKSIKIGQKIQESQLSIVEYLVAMAIKETGLRTIQRILTIAELNSNELKQYAQDLNQYYKNEDGLINAFKFEYAAQSWTVDAVINGNIELEEMIGENIDTNSGLIKKIKNNYYFQPNKTKLLLAEYTRAIINNAHKPCREIKTSDMPMLSSTDPKKRYTEENAFGKILHDILTASFTGLITRKCREDLLIGATQAMIAIRAYKNDTDDYPISLDNLIPDYLMSIPNDPFDGKSLKYSAQEKIIYSFGENTATSNDNTEDNWKENTNLTFKVNF